MEEYSFQGSDKKNRGFLQTRNERTKLPMIKLKQVVSFIGFNDRIDLVHKANNRSIFVTGAIDAALFLNRK